MAAVLIGATALGFSAIFVKWAEAGGATPITVGFYRMLFALPGAFAARLAQRRPGRAARGAALGTGSPASRSFSISARGTSP